MYPGVLGAWVGYFSGFRTLGIRTHVLAQETMGGTGQEIRFQCREELSLACVPLKSRVATLDCKALIFGAI